LTSHFQKNNKNTIFKMVQLTSLIPIFLAASGIVSALPNPATESKGTLAGPSGDLSHGIYTVDLAEDGSTVWTFVAPINETLKATTLATRDVESFDKRDGASCNGFGTPADE
jgi:multidrug efflux pump subunit AcrA (membrane-fusion protein)